MNTEMPIETESDWSVVVAIITMLIVHLKFKDTVCHLP